MDNLSKEKRSWNMSRIRSKNTKPELRVRSLLHGLGYRFRLHSPKLPGKPDIVLPKYRTVVFVHGCFWHRHRGCKYAYKPKSRQEFWERKFSDNVNRHSEVVRELLERGWKILVVWECQVRHLDSVGERLEEYISQQERSLYVYDLMEDISNHVNPKDSDGSDGR